MRVGFSGTQEGMTETQVRIVSFRLSQHGNEGCEFHHGLCIGADEQAHRLALKWGYRVHGHPPAWAGKMANLPPTDFAMLYPALSYLDRNKRIVEDCDLLIAAPNGPEIVRSGTWSTIRHARKLRRPVMLVMPNGDVTLERWDGQ